MNYTVSDFYNTYKEQIRLLCGKGGLVRHVSSVGILDYEFLPEVSGRYKHYNFDEAQLVVTTFMYARNNPNLVMDAIKDLISAGVSGLVIKDVFKIRIPDTAIRYAEAKNFPVFILEPGNLFVE
ncbi:MAG: PucR family transcriptional regulator ligand-binding domain-containing protein, partial [Firmicutes bacterium]|nr:PucR family transcriptional regulator ligand-binding domain-containing protein [Bacillota bacterium]